MGAQLGLPLPAPDAEPWDVHFELMEWNSDLLDLADKCPPEDLRHVIAFFEMWVRRFKAKRDEAAK